jgi:hypothetical protein
MDLKEMKDQIKDEIMPETDKPHDIRIITFNLLSPDVMTDKSMITYLDWKEQKNYYYHGFVLTLLFVYKK